MVREQIAAAFPDDARARRGGGRRTTARRPRRGSSTRSTRTANFARGVPIWATLIALRVDGELVLGVVTAPALGERYAAVRGEGATLNGARSA